MGEILSANYDMTKEELLDEARRVVFSYLDDLNIPRPILLLETNWRCRGYYEAGTVCVNMPKIRLPPKKPFPRMQSFPGSKTDTTPVGVLAHEVGHYIHDYLHGMRKYREIIAVQKAEPVVTSYEPNPDECVAEMCRLMITNPNLLRIGRPKRFTLLNSWGVIPAHDTPWKEVLKHAHENVIGYCESWIRRKN